MPKRAGGIASSGVQTVGTKFGQKGHVHLLRISATAALEIVEDGQRVAQGSPDHSM